MSSQSDRLSIYAIRSVDSRETTIRYIYEHARVLQDIGVTSALRLDYKWCLEDETTMIVAHHSALGLVGGCRLQYGTRLEDLPIYSHLLPFDPCLKEKLTIGNLSRRFEMCGLWVAHRFMGRGLPFLLTSAALAIQDQLKSDIVYCFAADYTKDLAVKNGFKIMTAIGEDGAVDFPIAGIRSYALVKTDPLDLACAAGVERERIQSLRREPEQLRMETVKGMPIIVQYNLQLNSMNIPLVMGLNSSMDERRMSA